MNNWPLLSVIIFLPLVGGLIIISINAQAFFVYLDIPFTLNLDFYLVIIRNDTIFIFPKKEIFFFLKTSQKKKNPRNTEILFFDHKITFSF